MLKKSLIALSLMICGCGADYPVTQKLEPAAEIPEELTGYHTTFGANAKNSRLEEKQEVFIPDDAKVVEKMSFQESNFMKVKYFDEELNDTLLLWIEY